MERFPYAHEIEEMPAATGGHAAHSDGIGFEAALAAAGEYKTVAACYDTDNTDAAKVPDLYRKKETVKDCTMYWDFGHK